MRTKKKTPTESKKKEIKKERPSPSSRTHSPVKEVFKKAKSTPVLRREPDQAPAIQSVQRGTIDKNWKGFAFLVFENKSFEDAYLSQERARHLFHGDRVEAKLNQAKFPVMISVLGHRFRSMVGRFRHEKPAFEGDSPLKKSKSNETASGAGGWFVYERKKAYEIVYLPPSPRLMGIREGDWLKIDLTFHEQGDYPVTGEVVEAYGDAIPASADIEMVSGEYGLNEHHSQQAEDEAEAFKFQIPPGRTDLRDVPFITIDGQTARDFDDAVFVEKQGSGFLLWVAIADVSYYVQLGTALDREAQERGTSVYFPERAFHMLPRKLSENLCSIRPLEPRLALVAKMAFDPEGNLIQTDLMEAVMESKRRATYEEIQAEFEARGQDQAWEYKNHFKLYHLLRKSREQRGTIDFDLPESEVRTDPMGEVLSIRRRFRVDSHRLIEEFMIAANEAVTTWMLSKSWPFVYRVHEVPSLASLAKFQLLAHSMGIPFSVKETITSKKIADLIAELDGHPAQALLNMAALRSMKQAVYSSVHQGHFGLASSAYTHFTSPIRRYPDLVVHRLIRMVLQGEKLSEASRKKLEMDLAQICEHCSYRERLAADAERESIKLKQVRLMAKHVGEDFDGTVVGMAGSGIFIQLGDPYVEGMISADTLEDDHYEWIESRMIFRGQRSGKAFKIGDQCRVKTVKADLDKRQIEFTLVSMAAKPTPSPVIEKEKPKTKKKQTRNSV